MDEFLAKKKCDRCGGDLKVRIMSRFNTDCICMKCAEEERQHPDYQLAAEYLYLFDDGKWSVYGLYGISECATSTSCSKPPTPRRTEKWMNGSTRNGATGAAHSSKAASR